MNKSILNCALAHLKNTQIFKDCEVSLLKEVLEEYSSVATYPKGETVFCEENYSPVLCLIIKGEARVSKSDTVISHLKVGEIYGGAFLYNLDFKFLNTVTAVTPLKVVILEKAGVDKLIRLDNTVSFNYITYLSQRVGFLNRKIEGYITPSAEEKLLLYLRKNCDENDGKCEISVSMTELSRVLHISRASLYRVIEALEKQGKICRDGKKIYLQKEDEK